MNYVNALLRPEFKMRISLLESLAHPVRYDPERHRLWILGQRCHHGATGALITGAAAAIIARTRLAASTRATLAGAGAAARAGTLAAVGSLLMLHDWKDHSIWFELGPGTQP